MPSRLWHKGDLSSRYHLTLIWNQTFSNYLIRTDNEIPHRFPLRKFSRRASLYHRQKLSPTASSLNVSKIKILIPISDKLFYLTQIFLYIIGNELQKVKQIFPLTSLLVMLLFKKNRNWLPHLAIIASGLGTIFRFCFYFNRKIYTYQFLYHCLFLLFCFNYQRWYISLYI